MKDSLGDRMKRYEASAKQVLTRRVPVIGRLDGRAFHTFARNCVKPYDANFHACMWEAAKAVCKDLMGAQLAYVQSDEITVLVTDYATHDTDAAYDFSLPKLCSTTAAMASVAFLVEFLKRFPDRQDKLMAGKGLPTFDARFYNVPKEDVENVFLWRQKDAERNSLSMLCQSYFSTKELHGVGNAGQHEKLHAVGVNWNNIPTPQKRGVCIMKEPYVREGVDRTRWAVDMDIPIFSTPEGREYIAESL